MTKWVLIDFETASACELKKAGAYVYAADPTTEITALAAKFADGRDVRVSPAMLADCSELRDAASDPGMVFVAHNAAFERAIWREIMCRVYGYPDIPIERWHDTMAVALQKGLPAKLEKVTVALHIPGGKDMEGNKLALSLSKPNKKTGMLDRSAATMQRVLEYCADDVLKEEKVLRIVKTFQGDERRVWQLDQKINDRGIRIDRAYVRAGMKLIAETMPDTIEHFRQMTKGVLFPDGIAPTQGEKFKEWLRWEGLKIDDLKKETIKRLMGDAEEEDDDEPEGVAGRDDEDDGERLALPESCRRALTLRGYATSASVKKLPAMLACCGADGRARGLLQYHGAGPGRWAGRILQPHNFPRAGVDVGDNKTASPAELVAAIMAQDASYLRMVFDEPVAAISAGLRHALVADQNRTFLVGDFAQIEARVVLAIAGQHDALKLFTQGDPYCTMAEKIFHHPVTKKEHPEKRQTGKNTILASGFGMGPDTFQARYAPKESRDFAVACIQAYRKDMAPKVPELWYALERASTKAVWDNTACETHGILYQMEGPWLTCRLPSGRKLFYFEPQRERTQAPWDPHEWRQSWSSMTFKMGRWKRRQMYGGLLTENIVQGAARDLLVYAMFNCEAAGIPIVLTVHDEIVGESQASRLHEFRDLMTERPQWAIDYGIPVAVEEMATDRYRK